MKTSILSCLSRHVVMNSSSPVTSNSTFTLIIPRITSTCSFYLLFFQPQSTRNFLPRQKPDSWRRHYFLWLFTCRISRFHPLLLSDHFPVFTELSINRTPLPPPTVHPFRRLHYICRPTDSFLIDLKVLSTHKTSSQISRFFSEVLIAYNTALSSVLDKHVPIITKFSTRLSLSIQPLVRCYSRPVQIICPKCWKTLETQQFCIWKRLAVKSLSFLKCTM